MRHNPGRSASPIYITFYIFSLSIRLIPTPAAPLFRPKFHPPKESVVGNGSMIILKNSFQSID